MPNVSIYREGRTPITEEEGEVRVAIRRGVRTGHVCKDDPETWETLISPWNRPTESHISGFARSVGVSREQNRTKPTSKVESMQGEPKQQSKDMRESEGLIRATKLENGMATGSSGAKEARVADESSGGNAAAAQTADVALTELWRIGEIAKQNPQIRFYSLAHHITYNRLRFAFGGLNRRAAPGIDGVTVTQYKENLLENIEELYERLKSGTYKHKPIRRVHIEKENGQKRPIGVSCLDDKVVQQAVREVLETIFEQDFLECSYGFRPRIGAHDAMRAIDVAAMRNSMNWVFEADIKAYFDNIVRKMLMEFVNTRVADGRLLRLVGKCLNAGVLDGEEFAVPELGTAQGSVLSPLLGNIYLHYVLDKWFEEEVKPRLKGNARLIRYADDFIIGFEKKEDAEKVMEVIPKRMKKHGLELHPEKTRLVPFNRPPKEGRRDKGRTGTFDFLGFTVYWRQTRKGSWVLGMKTRKARIKRTIQRIYEFCKSQRHDPVEDQHRSLCSRLQGHINYFGTNGNFQAIKRVIWCARRAWHKWLNRRSQRSRMTWERFNDLLEDFPLPKPIIKVQIWGAAP